MNTSNILAWLHGQPHSIESVWLESFLADTQGRHRRAEQTLSQWKFPEVKSAESPMRAIIREMLAPKVEKLDGGEIAVIHFAGPIAHAPDAWDMLFDGVEDSRALQNAVNSAASDSAVRGVLLDMNSPGGTVMGGTDVADAVAALSKAKPVVAWSGGMMASLAYQIASQATEIVTTGSANVGSIGAMITMIDVTKALDERGIKVEVITNKEATLKAVGVPGTSINDHQRAYLQDRVQSAFELFKAYVLSRRPGVKDSAMTGQTFWGRDAKAQGLVDRNGTREFALSTLRSHVRKKG